MGHVIAMGLSPDGMPDEILANAADVHIERMDENFWWMKIKSEDCQIDLWFHDVDGGVTWQRNWEHPE